MYLYPQADSFCVLTLLLGLLSQFLQSTTQVPRAVDRSGNLPSDISGKELEQAISCKYDARGQVHGEKSYKSKGEGVEEEVRSIAGFRCLKDCHGQQGMGLFFIMAGIRASFGVNTKRSFQQPDSSNE